MDEKEREEIDKLIGELTTIRKVREHPENINNLKELLIIFVCKCSTLIEKAEITSNTKGIYDLVINFKDGDTVNFSSDYDEMKKLVLNLDLSMRAIDIIALMLNNTLE